MRENRDLERCQRSQRSLSRLSDSFSFGALTFASGLVADRQTSLRLAAFFEDGFAGAAVLQYLKHLEAIRDCNWSLSPQPTISQHCLK